jgi:exodeoxyribonuclease V beta subunit
VRPLDPGAAPLEGTVLVEASAGTGKTFTLAHLYLRALLELDLEPRHVLVVTYTKAAAAELRVRIRRRLRAALSALGGGKPEDEVLGSWRDGRRARGTTGADAAHLSRCLSQIDSAAIHTIHAFAQRALCEIPFGSGAAFDAELLEDTDPLVDRIARDFWSRRLFAAEPALVAYLQEHGKLGPGALARLGRRVLHQPGVRLVPDGVALDPAAGARYAAAAADWAQTWHRSRDEVRALLESPALKRNVYPLKRIPAWLDELSAQAALSQPAPSWRVKNFERYTPQALEKGCRKGWSAPVHPFFESCARLVEAERALAPWAIALQLEFARELGGELARRLARAGLRSFADLIALLSDALRDPAGGPRLAAELRRRYPVALVDESQDTDPLQGEIFRRVWGEAGLPLFLIGDPKQAIYSFRGADVRAYLAARESARAVYTLDASWRSSPRLLRALDALLRLHPAPFEPEAIEYRTLEARRDARDVLAGPALELLVAQPERTTSDALDTAVCQGVAAEIETLLASAPCIGDERLAARDVAVLCRTNRQARRMRDALRERGVAAVLHGDESVLEGSTAGEVERVARALAQPGDAGLLRAALATRLLGLDAGALDALARDGSGFEDWVERVQRAHARWTQAGFAVALRTLLDEADAARRLLASPGGERDLTDALHVAERMHLAERQLHLGPRALVSWLAAERRGEGSGLAALAEEAQLRLESDGDAVQITTVHRSKGLEYGVVYVPFAWRSDGLRDDDRTWPRFHRPAERAAAFRAPAGIALDVGSEAHAANRGVAEEEARAEAMRLLYVALTRARHRVSAVYAPGEKSHESALGRLLGCAEGDSGEALVRRLRAELGARDEIAVRALASGSARPRAAAAEARAGAPRRLSRALPRARRTSSFSALVRRATAEVEGRDHDAHLADEAETAEGPRAFPGGAAVGLALHEALEHLDFPSADRESVTRAVERASQLHGVDAGHREPLVDCVLDALDAPLPPEDALRLRDVARAERVSELEFLIPVGDPSSAAHWLLPERLAQPFARRAAHPELRAYAERVRRLGFADLAGHLRGFIDLVFRHAGRWYLVDYKSNDLGSEPDAYAPARLAAPMREHDYLLQYHLYAVALHRWLARRIPRYDYERDFGGVYYLFLRGMSPSRPRGSGVWFDRPPLALVEALSAALARPGESAA